MRRSVGPLVTLLALGTVAPGSPSAVAAARTIPLSGSIVTQTAAKPDDRCAAYGWFQFSTVPGIDLYEVKYTDTITGVRMRTFSPPYPDEGLPEGLPAAGKGVVKVGVGAIHAPAGNCGDYPASIKTRHTIQYVRGVVCDARTSPRRCPTQIVGTVLLADGRPARGVRVAVDGPTDRVATTNAAGAYRVQVRPGRYAVTAPKGYCVTGGGTCKQAKRLTVARDGTGTASFRSPATVTLSGRFWFQEYDEQVALLELKGMSGGRTALARDVETGTELTAVPTASGEFRIRVPSGARYAVGPARATHGLRTVEAAADRDRLDFCWLVESATDETFRPCDLVTVSGVVHDIEGAPLRARVLGGVDQTAGSARGRFSLLVERGSDTVEFRNGFSSKKRTIKATQDRVEIARPVVLEPRVSVGAPRPEEVVVGLGAMPRGNYELDVVRSEPTAAGQCRFRQQETWTSSAGGGTIPVRPQPPFTTFCDGTYRATMYRLAGGKRERTAGTTFTLGS